MLQGLDVLEIGAGVAGASCGAILRRLGARVTKLEPKEREAPLFEPILTAAGGEPFSVLAALLDRDKTIRHFEAYAASAADLGASDIVICDRVVDRCGFPGDRGDYLANVADYNRGVWVTLTPFGLSGPYADYQGSELVACAAGGLAATIAPKGGGRPSLPPGWQGLLTTGHVAALAALHGLEHRRELGRPVHVDVSTQEAVAMNGALPECAHALYECPGRAGSGRYVAPSGLFACRDGLVRIVATDNHQWAGMVRAMGDPEWTRGLEDRESRGEHAARINGEIEKWTRPQLSADCAELLQKNGVPATPANTPDDLLRSPQFAARGFIEAVSLNGVATRVGGDPYTWRDKTDAFPVRDDRRGIRGLRVAEFAHVLAGPIAGALLGAMGAQVVRFEDRARLDLYRRTGPFARGISGEERGAYFAVSNHSKRSLAVDVSAEPEMAAKLVRWSDVVLENFGTKRMTRLGIDSRQAFGEDRALLYVSLSGFGQSGPLAEYRAYANNVHAYGGLTLLTRNDDGALVHIGSVLADPLSALTTATVVAAWALESERRGGIVDVSMAEVVADRLAEFIAEAGAGEARSRPVGCERFPYAPHGIHPTRDGQWLAIAVQGDEEWQALRGDLDNPRTLDEPAWLQAAGRWEARREIESRLDAITREHDSEALFHRLQDAGVRACPVWTGTQLIADPHLAARGFFPEIDHPEADLRGARIVGLAWRFVGEGPILLGPPPRLGDYRLPEGEA